MSASAKFTAVEAYRAYVEKFSPDLITQAFFSAKSLQYIQLHEGVKGRLTLTQMLLGDLSYRWGKTFAPTADTVEFKPRTLDVVAAKAEFQFVPQEFESSYLGFLRQTGQSSDDLPQEAFILSKLMQKIQQEIEVAIWQGVAAGSPASTDKINALFDGFITLGKALRTGGSPTIPATAVSGGAYTTSNIIGHFETMFKALDPAYQDSDLIIACSNSVYQLYVQAYRENYSKYVNVTPELNLTLDLAPKCKIVNFPGMGTSQFVMLTTPENLHYGYDAPADSTVFNFEKDHRAMDFWADFKLGVQIGLADPKCLRVNDLN